MAGQIIKRSEKVYLVRIFMGKDQRTGKRRYINKTIHGTKKDAQAYLNGALRDQDMGRFVERVLSANGRGGGLNAGGGLEFR